MRACQLGFLPERELVAAIRTFGKMPDEKIEGYMAQVRERLPAFARS
jgi:hypothetical protein